MLETAAVVRGIRAGHVSVEPDPLAGCAACAPTGCATKRLAGLFARRPNRSEIPSNEKFAVGDRVVVGVAEADFVGASFRAYIFPLITMLLGATLTGALAATRHADLAAVFGAVAGLVFGAMLQRGFAIEPPVTVRHAAAQSHPIAVAATIRDNDTIAKK